MEDRPRPGRNRGGLRALSLAAVGAVVLSLAPVSAWAAPESITEDQGSNVVEEQGEAQKDQPTGAESPAADAPTKQSAKSAPAAEGAVPLADDEASLSLDLSQTTGTEPFQANDDPGNDSGPDNDIVRTNDTITYKLGIRYEGDDQTNPTIAFELPRGQELVQLPPFCLAGSGVDPATLPAPASPLTATSWESLPRQTVTCVLKDEDMGTALNYAFVAQVRSEVPHGTQMDEVTFSVTSDQVVDPETIAADQVTVSAAAKFDLSKNNNAASANSGPLFTSQAECPAPYTSEACYRIAYPVTITVPAGGRGTTPLQSPITFVDNLDPESFYGAAR